MKKVSLAATCVTLVTCLVLSSIPACAAAHGTVTPPTAASAAGLTYRAFFDNFCFSSSVDINDTGNGPNAGYLWSVHNAWPNNTLITTNGFRNSIATAPATPSANISIASCQGTFSWALFAGSAGFSSGGPGYKGYTFSGDFYANACFSFDPSLTLAIDVAWPAFWMLPIEVLTGSIDANTGEVDEFDVVEAFPSADKAPVLINTIHDEKNTTTDNSNASVNASGITPGPANHCWSLLWQTAANHSGTGTVKWYYDGVQTSASTQTYTQTGAPSPAASPSSPNGTYYAAEGTHFVLLFDGGVSPGPANLQPVTIRKVEVWCSSAACMTTQR